MNKLKLNIQYFDTPSKYYSCFYVHGILHEEIELKREGSAFIYYFLTKIPDDPIDDNIFIGWKCRFDNKIYTSSELENLEFNTVVDYDAVFMIKNIKINSKVVDELKVNNSIVKEAKINKQIVYSKESL